MSPDAQKVAEYLESRIRKSGINAVTYYNPLASHFGMPPVTEAWQIHPLCGIFEELDLDDHSHGRPFRTAVVINEQKKYPGNGFFKMVKKLRFPEKVRFTESEMMSIYSQELVALEQLYTKEN
ncbi:MAG: hypothetical protein NTV51_11090 [Verrucomicrobia bacterium]|nr:hypothetical protein [Verrucomicrobiota bacterium]